MFGSITASQTSVQIVVFYLFFFSSEKEIKSAGTEKHNVFSPLLSYCLSLMVFPIIWDPPLKEQNQVPPTAYLTVTSALKRSLEQSHILRPPLFKGESMLDKR